MPHATHGLPTKTLLSSYVEELTSKIKYPNKSNRLLMDLDVVKRILENIKVPTVNSKYGFYDLFCGAGGMSIGFEGNGFSVVKAVEKDLSAVKTYHFNRPHIDAVDIIHDDITKYDDSNDFKYAPLVIGGPPCQGFSNANKQRQENDSRNVLYKYFVKKVSAVKPEIFIMENVVGIAKHLDEIAKDFNEVGYSIDAIELNSNEFGAAQNRKRLFIFGQKVTYKESHKLFDEFKSSIESCKVDKKFTLWDAIHDLPAIKAKTERNATYLEVDEWGGTFIKDAGVPTAYKELINTGLGTGITFNHKSKYNNDRDIEIYSLLSEGDKSDSPKIDHINPYKNRGDIFKDKFCKLPYNKPCKTITAHMYYDCHMYIHPEIARGLTPREAARVQGFSDDYLFIGTPNEWYRQIGNAVSPLVSKALGFASFKVLEHIFDNENCNG
ncbi:DNA cytosine methyltransferase [Psychromonas hadalis]|uniref:DNA cytosine methyltransferase n=1 Tax=Psychromonas hadalis TaxID=211669 RepID=UPI00146F6673|nr:DNA cytosine methyltransferase [Psychromonas hadalis]